MDDLYLCVSLSDAAAAAGAGSLCRMEYFLDREGTLLRSGSGAPAPGDLLALAGPEVDSVPFEDPSPLCDLLAEECLRREAAGLVCDFEGRADELRTRLCRCLSERFAEEGLRLYLPEVFGAAASGACRLISSGVMGEPCAEAFRRAVLRYGAGHTALLCEPLCADCALPPQGVPGSIRPLTVQALKDLMAQVGTPGYYSQELCARYFTYRDRERHTRFVVYDDPTTLRRKIALAKSCGIETAFLCWPHYAAG